jgi:hypothetical protein
MLPILRASLAVGLSTVLLFLTGCGLGQAAHQADPDQAKTTLHAVLDAWKAGASLESLEAQSTPIRVMDLDWKDGKKLISYHASAEGKLVGFDMNYPVVLELKNRKGSTVKKSAVYTVTTHPEILVMRQEG